MVNAASSMGGESQRATSSGLNALQLSPASQQPVRLETAEFLASLGQPVASTSHTDAVHFSTASSHIFGQNSLPRDLETSSRELDGPTRACSPTPLAAGPEQGLDSVMPFPSILAVVDLFFTTLWHRLPILHRPSLASRLASRHDRIDPAFYSLVANICAATCVSSRSLPLLPILAACGCSTWLDAGKRFNSATMATGHRIHQLAKAGSTVCAQNVLLVASYECSRSSPVADRLFAEAERIAHAAHFPAENPGLDAVQRELRRRIYWSLCAHLTVDSMDEASDTKPLRRHQRQAEGSPQRSINGVEE